VTNRLVGGRVKPTIATQER